MSQYVEVDPERLIPRTIQKIVQIIDSGGVAIIPTDSCYSLVCAVGNIQGSLRIRRIKQLSDKDHLTLMCKDLTELAQYARVDNAQYRFLKQLVPGPYAFILEASKEVPKKLAHPGRKTIGLRIPDHPITQAILVELQTPLVCSTLMHHGEILNDPTEFKDNFINQVDVIVDGGLGHLEPTTIIDLITMPPVVLRQGLGVIELGE